MKHGLVMWQHAITNGDGQIIFLRPAGCNAHLIISHMILLYDDSGMCLVVHSNCTLAVVPLWLLCTVNSNDSTSFCHEFVTEYWFSPLLCDCVVTGQCCLEHLKWRAAALSDTNLLQIEFNGFCCRNIHAWQMHPMNGLCNIEITIELVRLHYHDVHGAYDDSIIKYLSFPYYE